MSVSAASPERLPVQGAPGASTADERLRHLVAAARTGGLSYILGSLRRSLDAEVAFFDTNGNVLSSAPTRTLWDFDRVLTVLQDVGETSPPFFAHMVEVDGETVGVLAARTSEDPWRLLPVAIDLIALEIGKLRAKSMGESRLLGALLEEIFAKRVADPDAIARLAAFGIDASVRNRVVVGWNRSALSGRPQVHGGSLYSLVRDQPDPLVRVGIGAYTVMVVPDDPMAWRLAETLQINLAGGSPEALGSVRVGVGLPHIGPGGLRASYYEALTAVQEGDGVRSPERADLSRLLVMMNSAEPLRDMARALLGPLVEFDRTHSSDLLHTLRVFLECNRNIQAATDALFVHRNTLRYRRGQIEELLGMNLDDSTHIANLWLAFAIIDDVNAQDGEGRP